MAGQSIVTIKVDENKKSLIHASCGEYRSCSLCPVKSVHVDNLCKDTAIKHRILHKHNKLYRQGEKVNSLYVVHSGVVKTQCIFPDGSEQVMGFYLPGDILGFDGLANQTHKTSAIALGTASVCEFSYHMLDSLFDKQPDLARQCMRLMSEEIVKEQQMISSIALRSAEERLAGFLIDLSERYVDLGLLATPIIVPMLRRDIGNYLGIKPETVSRVLKRFEKSGWIRVNRREVDILDVSMLKYHSSTWHDMLH